MPSIEGGGVEKNLFLLSNYLSKKLDLAIITADNLSRNKFNKKIQFIKKNLIKIDKDFTL